MNINNNINTPFIKFGLVIGLLLFIFNYWFLTDVFAHVLKTDGTIGAVVHINPEDDPIVGVETTIYFDVKDTTNKFLVENCECRFLVKVNNEQVYEQLLTDTTATYNFPEKNVYQLALVGTPKSEGQFQPFSLSYDVRVEREMNNNSNSLNEDSAVLNFVQNHIPHILIISVVLFICIFIIYHDRKKDK